jgi:hypothetical protein
MTDIRPDDFCRVLPGRHPAAPIAGAIVLALHVMPEEGCRGPDGNVYEGIMQNRHYTHLAPFWLCRLPKLAILKTSGPSQCFLFAAISARYLEPLRDSGETVSLRAEKDVTADA